MKRRNLLQGGTLSLLLGSGQLARGAAILAVRLWPAPDYTRVTIESDTALKARHFVVSSPPRLVVDTEGLDLLPGLQELIGKVGADDPYISGIRAGQYSPGVVRLVLDLKQEVMPQVFSLPPVAAYQHRLVFDLFPARPVDPLELLIAERLADQASTRHGPEPLQDPLGELIHRHTVAEKPKAPPSPAATASRPGSTPAPAPVSRPETASANTSNAALPADRLIVIALDPGHGGEDPGAVGPSGTREKDVVLQIAHRLRERINATTLQSRGGTLAMRAFMTRDADYFVPLHVRVQKARRVQADLFVSIHADAFFTPTAGGASVFALSQGAASSSAARWMAAKENNADKVGGLNMGVQDAQVVRALFDMSTTAQIKDSLQLGGAMLGEIRQVGRLHKAQVEQAGFAVLKAPDIPSVLVETAFISNPEEEARLGNESFQNELADALMRGIRRYFARNPPLARNRST